MKVIPTFQNVSVFIILTLKWEHPRTFIKGMFKLTLEFVFQTACILNDFLAVDFTESAPLHCRKGIWDLEVKWLKWDHIVLSCRAPSRIPLTSFSVSSSSLPLAKSCPSSFISLCGELLGPNPTNSTTIYQVPTVCQTLGAGHRVMIKIETAPAWRLYKI